MKKVFIYFVTEVVDTHTEMVEHFAPKQFHNLKREKKRAVCRKHEQDSMEKSSNVSPKNRLPRCTSPSHSV